MYEIVVYNPEDLTAIAEMEKACFQDNWDIDALTACSNRADFYALVLKKDGVAVGYIFGSTLFENAEIFRVAVLAEYRGNGLGERLVQEGLAHCKGRGAETMFLEVRDGNFPARGLYKKLGFEEFHIRKKYYPNGEDAVEMKKSI